LANAQHRAAQENLAAAEEFEQITSLLLSGGEVASVDLTRAHLQTLTRRYEFSRPVNATDLAVALPNNSDYQQFKAEDVARRPEFLQLDQQLRAARAE